MTVLDFIDLLFERQDNEVLILTLWILFPPAGIAIRLSQFYLWPALFYVSDILAVGLKELSEKHSNSALVVCKAKTIG